MQLKKYHIRKTPTYQPEPYIEGTKPRKARPDFAPHGVRRSPSDFDQKNNAEGRTKPAKPHGNRIRKSNRLRLTGNMVYPEFGSWYDDQP